MLCYMNMVSNHFNFIIFRTSSFDRKCVSGRGCWYCCSKCDVCMLDSKPGFAIEGECDSDPKLRFCGENCQSLFGPPQPFVPSNSVQKPLTVIKFPIVSSSTSGECGNIEVIAIHLLGIKCLLPKSGQCPPTYCAVDVYRVVRGTELPPGRLFTLFDLKSLSDQIFGEFYLTDVLQLDDPLPHYSGELKKDSIRDFNTALNKGIQECGLSVDGILSLVSPLTPYSQ